MAKKVKINIAVPSNEQILKMIKQKTTWSEMMSKLEKQGLVDPDNLPTKPVIKRGGKHFYPIEGMDGCYSSEPGHTAIPFAPWYEVQWEIFKANFRNIKYPLMGWTVFALLTISVLIHIVY